jgi:hypothetical protein
LLRVYCFEHLALWITPALALPNRCISSSDSSWRPCIPFRSEVYFL